MKIGDVVAIRGDLRVNMDGKSTYLPSQLIDGKYIKHSGHSGIWTGVIEKIKDEYGLVAGGWRPLNHYEVIFKKFEY